ncbi:hypothetical protein Prum_067620 [Phytohabitans rumicis]|uniref:Transposase IS4-like domain-containing protein n=1 Tax=Phytohabitans rumicis TaxID=1076125 RepID=A0A6V8LBW4_9ACTN|nr:hypothetical protein Prum_067620 [Phytohabitans rumicis]
MGNHPSSRQQHSLLNYKNRMFAQLRTSFPCSATPADRALHHRQRTRPDHPPHHPGPARPADLPFPHVNQVYLIERYVTDTAGTSISAVTQLGAASHRATRATPADLACYVQGQWAIEALHWIRDTCYREDHSRVRTRSGPRVLASLRNLAIGALRLAGRADITEATRWASRNMTAIHHPGPHIMILKRP